MTRRLTLLLVLALLGTGSAAAQYTTPQEVLEANIEATGGRTAWENIESLHLSQEIITELPQGLLTMASEAWIIFPGYVYATTEQTSEMEGMPAMNTTIYVTPEGGWMDTPMGRQDAPAEVRDQNRSAKEEIALLAAEAPALALLDEQSIDDRPAYVIQVGGETGMKRFYDKETLLLVAVEQDSQMGPMMRRVSDYKEVDGLTFGHTQEMDMGGQMRQSVIISAIDINPAISPEELAAKAGEGQE